MMKISNIKILMVFNLLCIQAWAQNKTVPFIDTDIKIDGRLDEAVWQEATIFDNFNNYYPIDEDKATREITIKVFHNGENLIIGATYKDTTAENKISTLKRDNHYDAVVSSDALGIVIDPFNKENNGYYFTLNAGNAQMDALINFNGTDYDFTENWNAVWKSNTSTVGKEKVYEMEIPLKSFNFDLNNEVWGIQFFYRDFKINKWMSYTKMTRNFFQFDLRFTEDVIMEQLPKTNPSRYTIIPSMTYSYENQIADNQELNQFTPSLDAQYSINSSLRLDATINPDFSQIDVDQQVVNLTRFAINFPERRNFFIENSDLFNNLGTFGVNPFYSRRIGGTSDMKYGLKLSGNVTADTKIGILNAQTENDSDLSAQNYTVLVGQHKISDAFTSTLYLVNKQNTEDLEFSGEYNRVLGANINYKSLNDQWAGLVNIGKSYSPNLNSDNHFFNIESQYNTRTTYLKGALKTLDKNYIADVGFTPRLYNYDPITDQVVRAQYFDSFFTFSKTKYPQKSDKIDRYRYLSLTNDTFWDQDGNLNEISTTVGNAIWFKKNLDKLYVDITQRYVNLNFAFDVLNNDHPILAKEYNNMMITSGYDNQSTNQDLYYGLEANYGEYFIGTRTGGEFLMGYRMLPMAHVNFNYSPNHIDLNELGEATFHLARLTAEIFFSTRLNWTTYVQYNTQFDALNINSRLQWEYKPLSYVYLVVSDNFDQSISRSNWGVALKVNYRFDI